MTDEKALEMEAKKELERGKEEAEKLLNNKDKLTEVLLEVEEKSKSLPLVGELISRVAILVEMLREYTAGTYRNMPIATAVAIVSALVYFLSPIDLITDALPVIGHIDDAAVIGACFSLINDDIEKYARWRDAKKNKDK